ncbi:MAG: YqgE/AlgH family protein [Pirellulales bacterium]
MPTLAGSVLIAAPELIDPNFARSVVLLVKHDEDGALGLILNRPAPIPFPQVWAKISDDPCPLDADLFVGGPCGGPLMALHDVFELGDLQAPAGVFFTADLNNIRGLIDKPDAQVRIFGGYSGWNEGQLERELADGGWLVRTIDKETVFSAPNCCGKR